MTLGTRKRKLILFATFVFQNLNRAWHGEAKFGNLIMQQRSPFILNRRIGYVATKRATTQCPQHGFHVQTQGHAIVGLVGKGVLRVALNGGLTATLGA